MIGREFGPLTLAELRGLVAEGRLAANDPVRWGTEGEWRSASAIEALFFAPPALSDPMVESPTAVSAPRSRAAAPPSGPAPVPLAEPEADPAKPSDQDRTLAWLEKHCPTPDSVAAQATTAQPVPPAAPGAAAAKGAAPAKPVEASRAAATNILRSMSADVVRKPTAQAKGASRPAASGPSLGEQLGQIPPKYLAIGGAAAAIVLFFWFGGMSLIPGMGYGSVYDSLQSVQSQVVAARQEHSAVSQTVKASLKEILKKLPRPSRVSGKSPYASLKQAHKYLNEMADSTGMPPPPSGGEDPYVRAEKNYQESMQRAAKLLGKK
jgi:hypothetical protein